MSDFKVKELSEEIRVVIEKDQNNHQEGFSFDK
jgi:hypothetical protein